MINKNVDSKEYVEDSSIVLPVIENGVQTLGDLWDCRKSIAVNHNLFKSSPNDLHLRVNPIGVENTKFHHIKTTEDKFNTIEIDGSLKLELLAGLIKVKGAGGFDQKSSSDKYFEQIIYRHDLKTFTIELTSKSKELVNQDLFNKLLNEEIKATHVVSKIWIGAFIDASITATHNIDKDSMKISGSLFGKFSKGLINVDGNLKLNYNDTSNNKTLEIKVSVESRPPMKSNPQTIEDINKMIQNIDSVLNKNKHFKQFKNIEIIGVPVKFTLIPIKDYLNLKIENLYAKLSDNTFENFKEMLNYFQDYSLVNCIRNRVYEKYSESGIILFNENSQISKIIKIYETNLIIITKDYLSKAIKTLKDYKSGKATEQDILKLINDCNRECKINEVNDKIMEFVNKCKEQLNGIKFKDSLNQINDYKLFSDEISLNEWFDTETKPKILLKTDGNQSIKFNLVAFYQQISDLKALGFDIGVAIPSVCNEFSLNIKIDNEYNIYKNNDEITFFLNVLKICLGNTTVVENLFWQAYGEIRGIKIRINKNTLENLFSVIDLIKTNKHLIIERTPIKTKNLLFKKDNKWRFYFPLDGVLTTKETIKQMILIRNSNISFENIDWVVGQIGLNRYNTTPILFLIKNSKIHLIVTDYLDVLILINNCQGKKLTEIDFEKKFNGLLSIESLDQTTSQEKADYIIDFYNIFSIVGKKKKVLLKNHPFKRFSIMKYNEILNKIKLNTSYTNGEHQITDKFFQEIPLSVKAHLQEGNTYSALDELSNFYYNDNFNELKESLEELYSFEKIQNVNSTNINLDKFKKNELEYIFINKRFTHVFGKRILKIAKKFCISPEELNCMSNESCENGNCNCINEFSYNICSISNYLMNHQLEIYKKYGTLIKEQKNINAKMIHENYDTLLHKAALRGDKDIIEKLILNGADVNIENRHKKTPLHQAVKNDSKEIVELLISKGADVNREEALEEITNLYAAIENGNKDIVELLISKGVDVNNNISKQYTPLHQAVLNGNKDMVELLISKGADVNTGHGIATPLYAAIENGFKDIVELLISKGADVNKNITHQYTPLHQAILNGNKDIVELLISKGADVNIGHSIVSPLFLAIVKGNKDIVELLISKGVDVDNDISQEYTPLHQAILYGNKDMVELLISKGANVNEGHFIVSPFYFAINKGKKDIVELLISKGADVNNNISQLYTPLHQAILNGNKDMVELLISKGADVNIGHLIVSPLFLAIVKGYKDIVELLISNGVDVINDISQLYTPLHQAGKNGNKDIVELLTSNGAVNIQSLMGKRLLNIAQENGFNDIVRILNSI